MLDAYSIRKAIPRIVLAVIGINLSIYLCVIALDLTTIVGRGMGGLLTGAFIPDGTITIDGELLEYNLESGIAMAGVLGFLGFKIITIGVGPLIISLLPLIGIIGLIALAVFFTLAIRQGLLIFLTAVSPVALALFVLPGTEKYFKQWWDLFVKTLMMYPIIAVIFAMSNVMASIMLSDTSSGGTASILNPASLFNTLTVAQATSGDSDALSVLKLFTGIVVIYAPLVLIPFSFKLAGGALAAVMNAAQGASANTRGGLQKNRGEKLNRAKQTRAMAASQGGLKGGWRRPMNSAYNAVGRRRAAGTMGVTRQGRQKLARHTGAGVEETLKNNAALRDLANFDDGNNLLALSGGSEAGLKEAARQLFGSDTARAEEAMAAARGVGVTRQNAAAALQTSAQNKWRSVPQGRSDLVDDGINRLAGSNAAEAASLKFGNQFHSRANGRVDLGGNYMSDEQDIANLADQIATSQGLTAPTDAHFEQATQDLAVMDGINRVSAPEAVRAHTNSVQAESDSLRRMVDVGTPQQKEAAIKRMMELNGHKASAPPANREIINKMLNDATAAAGFTPDSGVSPAVQLEAMHQGVSAAELGEGSRVAGIINENKRLSALADADPSQAAAILSRVQTITPAERDANKKYDDVVRAASVRTKQATVYGDDVPENMRNPS